MGDFTMPSLGADMDAGTVVRWLIKPGDDVRRGDVVAVIDTEKATIQAEIFESGVVDELVVHEGERVPVGTVLAHLSAPTVTTVPAAPYGAPEPAPVTAPAPAAIGAAPGPLPLPPRLAPVAHSPVVRHLAQQLGVDLAELHGTGPGGAVTRADVERAARPRAGEAPGRRRAPRRAGALAGTAGRPVPAPGPRTAARRPVSPYARRLAAELGVDLTAVTGTGPRGSVVAQDVRLAAAAVEMPAATRETRAAERKEPVAAPLGETAAAAPEAPAAARAEEAPQPASAERQAALRRAIGALMARSKREIPHYYLSTTIDVGTAVSWLEQANLNRPVPDRLVLPVLLLKATARAVAKVPEMNGFFVDDAFAPSDAVHVGVAVSLRTGGVIAPAIHDTERLSLDELMEKLRDLVGRARAGALRSSEMSDPTITVTNLGDLGVEAVFGVIYPPQVALVGFGRATERPVAQHGLLGVRPCVTATLSADHRASDGHRGGRFLAEIDRLLQEPEKL